MKNIMNPPEYLPSFSEINKALGESIPEEDLQKLDVSNTLFFKRNYLPMKRTKSFEFSVL